MTIKIINLYCDSVIKPLEKRKKELEEEIYTHRFVSRCKKEELRLVSELLLEKCRYLANLTDELLEEE